MSIFLCFPAEKTARSDGASVDPQALYLLMDEPSASLDQESIERLVIMARDLLERGSSLVITSHQTNALTALCKKQWWIKERQLIESPLLQIVKENNDNHTNTSHASTFRH